MFEKIKPYYDLCKPKVVLMMLLTAWVGVLLVPGRAFSVVSIVLGLVGIGLMSCSGGVFNHVLDVRNDQLMKRTAWRPLVTGQLSGRSAFLWALCLAVSGFFVLYFFVNSVTAFLSLFAFVGYAFFYTGFLKYQTSQNIVIGGLFGALPPLLGWTAITGSVSPYPLVLVLVVFLWTPPHFWALAIAKKEEYEKTPVPVFPVVYGLRLTGIHMVLYSVLLLVVGLLPYFMGENTQLYLWGALVLNGLFLIMALLFVWHGFLKAEGMRLFYFSVWYIPVFFLLILLDRYFFGIGF